MAAEHVVAAGANALNGHSAALPDEVRLVDALHPTSVWLYIQGEGITDIKIDRNSKKR